MSIRISTFEPNMLVCVVNVWMDSAGREHWREINTTVRRCLLSVVRDFETECGLI